MTNRTTIRNTLWTSLLALTVAVLAVVAMTGRAEAAGASNPAASDHSPSVATTLAMRAAVRAARGAGVNASPAAAGCPQSGQRVKGSSATVYLVDPDGFYDIIPNSSVYLSLWGSWSGITTLSDATLSGCALLPLPMTGAHLTGDRNTGAIYIYDATIGGAYRWIVNMGIFNKYAFDASKVQWQYGAPGPVYVENWWN